MGLGIRKISISILLLPFIGFMNLVKLLTLLGNLFFQIQIMVNNEWVMQRIKYVKEMVYESVFLFPFSFPFFTGRKSTYKSEKGFTLLISVALTQSPELVLWHVFHLIGWGDIVKCEV